MGSFPDVDDATSPPGAALSAEPRPPWRGVLPYALAAIPAVWMTALLLGGSKLQYNDYWLMIDGTFREDGLFDVGSLFEFQNEHPVVIPKLVYWLNAQVAAGSNLTLGLVVVVVVALQVVLVRHFVAKDDRPRAVGVVLLVVSSILVFSRQGAHNFFLAMSGTAWLTANLFALAALVAQWKARTWLAIGLGVLASLSYGTGLAVWPALIVLGMVADRRWRPDLKVAAYGVLVVIGYYALREATVPAVEARPFDIFRGAVAVLGSVLHGTTWVTQVVGALGLAVATALSVLAVRRSCRAAAPWVALLTYATVAAFIIGRARWVFIDSLGNQSRYASIGALFWLGVVGLTATIFGNRRGALVPAIAVGVLALSFGGDAVREQQEAVPGQAELTAAMHLDLADGYNYFPLTGLPRVAPLLESTGHYPFDGSYDGDCGLVGQRLPKTGAVSPEDGQVEAAELLTNGRGVRVTGWVPTEAVDDVRCVLVVDWTRRVVGYGATGVVGATEADVDRERGFAAVAPAGSPEYGVYLVLEDGVIRRLSDEVRSPAPGPVVTTT